MKKDPNDTTFRAFTTSDNRNLVLTQEKASDFLDGSGKVIEAIAGKWFFDVEQVLDGQPSSSVKTIYRGTILFQNDITGSAGVEVLDPITGVTFESLTDTQVGLGTIAQVLEMNGAADKLIFVDKKIVGFKGTKAQFNTELSDGSFMFIGDAPTAHTHTFASLTSKPTTLSGYGIIDTKANFNTSLSDGTFAFLGATQIFSGVNTFLNTKFKLRNVADTFNGSFVNTNTADRIYTLQNSNGTLAFVTRTIVGITGTKAELNTVLTNGKFIFEGDAAIKVSSNDTTLGFLEDKMTTGRGV
ncbi:MAG: hypothetical protein QQN55_03635, partial [Nitrosopumilus sp.]